MVIIYLHLPAGDPRAQLDLLSSAMETMSHYGSVDFEFVDSGPLDDGRDRP